MTAASLIRVRDLAIGWSRDAVLLERATFDVRAGEIFGILGRSACGKSTLLRVLVGLEPPLAGEISIAGEGPPRLGAGFGARVESELRFQLHDERTVLASGEIAVERDARGRAIELVVAAIGAAMEAATAELAARVVRQVCP